MPRVVVGHVRWYCTAHAKPNPVIHTLPSVTLVQHKTYNPPGAVAGYNHAQLLGVYGFQ